MTTLSTAKQQALLAELAGLKRFSRSLTGNAADADDLLQLTIERLLERGMPEDAHVAKWAYRVCRNLWLDELRSRDVRQRYAQGEVAANTDMPAQRSDGYDSLTLDRASAAMAELPEDQRSALVLVAVEGRSYAEVAEVLEIPIGTVMSRVARARRSLATKLE